MAFFGFGPPNVDKLKANRDVEGLIKALGYQKDVNIRKAAAEALAEMGPLAIDPLVAALKDESYVVRKSAIESLGKIGNARAVDPLVGIATSTYNDLSWVAIEALKKMGEIHHAVDPLIAALKDESSVVRRKAATALGKIGDARAVDPLIAALKDEVSEVRRNVVEALTEMGPLAIDPLVAALKNKNADVRGSAADLLDKLDWKPDLGEIGTWFWIAKKDWYRCAALGTPAVEPLIAVLKDESSVVRREAAAALEKIGDARAVDPLIAALKDGDGSVRKAAAIALEKIGDARAVDPLIAALRDSDSDVRICAADALGKIGDARAVDPLIAVLKDGDGSVRKAAAIALEKLDWKPDLGEDGAWYWVTKKDWEKCVDLGTPAVEPLIATIKDGDGSVRKAAVEALGKIRETCVVDPLITALKDGDGSVREAAAIALEKLDWKPDLGEIGAWFWIAKKNWEKCVDLGTPAVEPLIATLKDKEGSVRRHAAESLKKMFHSGQLDDPSKKQILEMQRVMAEPYNTSTSDCGSWHNDWGIGVTL